MEKRNNNEQKKIDNVLYILGLSGKEGRIYCGLDKKEFEIWQDTDRLA